MSTTLDPHSVAHADHDHHGDHDHHDHPGWLAHHFESAEQQYDSGKLGMWLFLVTEVLFFSGMFCAYALYRSLHPEVFVFASNFLNKGLGAINTGVLLFSSLTMAWAVRAAQLSQHRLLVGMLGATLGCAAIFLGVKAVEYTHKWDLGLFFAGAYVSQLEGAEHHSSRALMYLSIVPGIILVGAFVYYFASFFKKDFRHRWVSGPILVAAACFFGGIKLGQVLTEMEESQHALHEVEHAAEATHEMRGAIGGSGEAMSGSYITEAQEAELSSKTIVDQHTSVQHAGHAEDAKDALGNVAEKPLFDQPMYVPQAHPEQVATGDYEVVPNATVNQRSMAGVFFSIYYAMTGIHAIHILAGMAVITWVIIRAANKEFHSQYFGVVDNVGLYWHLVDFIWIYLFPLLYLIT